MSNSKKKVTKTHWFLFLSDYTLIENILLSISAILCKHSPPPYTLHTGPLNGKWRHETANPESIFTRRLLNRSGCCWGPNVHVFDSRGSSSERLVGREKNTTTVPKYCHQPPDIIKSSTPRCTLLNSGKSIGATGAHSSPWQASGFYNWTPPCQTEGQTWQLMKLPCK